MFLIDDLLLWLPVKGMTALFKKIYDLTEAELNDEAKLKEQLLRFQTMFELDQISEGEYQKREDEIMARLNEIRERKKRETLSQ
ncbi:MAG: gas vesicle protein GvpG [Parcubacteria group bacterium]|nr:gas vesicle protein GvpG [Parcubacteria group bacterium]